MTLGFSYVLMPCVASVAGRRAAPSCDWLWRFVPMTSSLVFLGYAAVGQGHVCHAVTLHTQCVCGAPLAQGRYGDWIGVWVGGGGLILERHISLQVWYILLLLIYYLEPFINWLDHSGLVILEIWDMST